MYKLFLMVLHLTTNAYSPTNAITTLHFTKHGCVMTSDLSTSQFTPVVSKVQCVAKCRYTEGCVGVAVDRGTSSSAFLCGLLGHPDVPVGVISCGVVPGASVVVYIDPDVDLTTTSTTTTTTPATTTSLTTAASLDPLSSCHCVYDMDRSTDSYSEALGSCTDIGGFLPEIDVVNRLQVGNIIFVLPARQYLDAGLDIIRHYALEQSSLSNLT